MVPNGTKKNGEARFKSYLRTFKSINTKLKDVSGTKYVITEDDMRIGIVTIKQKLERDCPGFERMSNLFGSRQNINPTYLFESGESSDSSDDDDDDDEAVDENQPPANELPINTAIIPAVTDEMNSTTSTIKTSTSTVSLSSTKSLALSSEVLKAASEAAASNPNSNCVSSKKRDNSLGGAYLMKCEAEAALNEKRFKWEQECHKEKQLTSREEARQQLVFKCIDKGYSPNTTDRYLNTLFPKND